MAGEGERPEDQLQRLLTEQQKGPRVFKDAGENTPLVETAGRLANASRSIPLTTRDDIALRQLLSQVENARNEPKAAGVRALLGTLFARPVLRSGLAATAAIVVVGGAGLGAAAATGSAQPVRELLRISSDSAIKVEFTGIVIAVNDNEALVDANGDVRAVVVGASTRLTHGAATIALADIVAGQTVEVHGRLRPDNKVDATRVHIEDAAVSPTAGIPTEAVLTEPASGTPAPEIDLPGFVPTEDSDHHGDDAEEPDAEEDKEDRDASSTPAGDDDGADDSGSGSGGGEDGTEDKPDGSGSDEGSGDDGDDGEADGEDDPEEPDGAGEPGGSDAGGDDH